MRIGSLSGFGSMNPISAYNASKYSVSSVHGNPKSLDPIGKVTDNSQSAKPFAILNKEQEDNLAEKQKIAEKQTMTAAKDYADVMQQMMSGRSVNFDNLVQINTTNNTNDNNSNNNGINNSEKFENLADNMLEKAKSGEMDVAVLDRLTENQASADNSSQSGTVSYQMQRAMNAYSEAFAMGAAI